MRGALTLLASLELVSRLSPSIWHKTTGPTVLSHDTKPCRRTSAWEAIRTDSISESILLRPWGPFLESPGNFTGPKSEYSNRNTKNKSAGPG